jgi:hypothetical protein
VEALVSLFIDPWFRYVRTAEVEAGMDSVTMEPKLINLVERMFGRCKKSL